MPIVDAHCDTLTVLGQQNRDLGVYSTLGHLDLPRLRKGLIDIQFFAIFVGPEYYDSPVSYTSEIIALFNNQIKSYGHVIDHVRSYSEILRAIESKKSCAILTIEGGEALSGQINQLEIYYKQGVRGLTLTWNGRNDLGDGVGLGSQANGLTSFGRQVVQRMTQLGMIIDVSHLSEVGFWDVLQETKIPIVATHSNCKYLCDHPRNLCDQQIQAIANQGGVIGITYVPQFIHVAPSLERFMDHIDHIYRTGGIECMGLGSDFDGIDSTIEGLHDASVAVPNIQNALYRRGYTTGQIEKILGDNWLRVFKEVCG